MKFLSTFVLLAALSVFVEAASFNHNHARRSNHNGISRRANGTRCKQRPANNTSTDTGNNGNNSNTNNNSNKDNQSTNNSSQSNPAPNSSDLINVQDGSCGPNGATAQVTETTCPNGSIDWMNCGVDGAGWNPPFVRVSDLVVANLDDAISQGGPFTACKPYVWAFDQFGAQYGLPPILLASIALQESTCNPGTVGGNGEQGLMQLTQDKCGNAPGGNCQDVGYNVMTGAAYFVSTLAANGDNFFAAVGSYNGWKKGMTIADATGMRYSHCRAQNNLDYIFQLSCGWLQNVDAYAMHLGRYHNLDVC